MKTTTTTKTVQQAIAEHAKRQEVIEMLDALVTAGLTHTMKSAEYRALSWKLRHRGLTKVQLVGLVHSFRASHYRAHRNAAELEAMRAEGLNLRDFAEYHAELVEFLVLPIRLRTGHRFNK